MAGPSRPFATGALRPAVVFVVTSARKTRERRFDGPRFRIKPFGIRSVHVGLLPGAEILKRVAEYRCCRYGHNRSPMPRRDHGRMTASCRNFQCALRL